MKQLTLIFLSLLLCVAVTGCNSNPKQCAVKTKTYGAIPNDTINDEGALKTALSTGCNVQFEAGVYKITKLNTGWIKKKH